MLSLSLLQIVTTQFPELHLFQNFLFEIPPTFFKCNRKGGHGYIKSFWDCFRRKLSLRGSKQKYFKLKFAEQRFIDVFISKFIDVLYTELIF